MNMNISDKGLAMVKSFEGLRLTAYQDCVGVWTVGYGTTHNVHPGMVVTEGQAETLLLADLRAAELCVNTAVKTPQTQGQFDACVSFVYNVGQTAFLHSTLLSCINEGKNDCAAGQFLAWDHAGGKVVPGLLARRKAEAAMYRGQA